MKKTEKLKPAKAKESRILNILPSQGRERDWRWDDAPDATKAVNRLPEAVDLRSGEMRWWGTAEDQKNTGACVGHAVGTVLFWHFFKQGLVSRSARNKPSFRHLWMASKEIDTFTSWPSTFLDAGGTYIKTCLDVARKYGSVTNRVLPMNGLGVSMPEGQFNALAAQRKIKSYHACSPYGEGFNMQGFKYWLANHGPIVARLEVDKAFMFANRRTGVIDHYGGGMYGGHAVVIAGYDEAGNFLVKNSWGRRWGNRGFIWVSEKYAKAAFNESYGVTV